MNIPCESEWNEYKLFNLKEDECVIYSFYDQEDKIIYVGRTQSFTHRMIAHKIEKKDIKKVCYFMTKQDVSEEVEKQLIQLYRPKYNKNKKQKVKIITPLQKKIEKPQITRENIQGFFLENSVDISFFSKKSGHTERFLKGLMNGTIELKKRTAENMRILMKVYLQYWEKERATNGEVKEEDLMKGE